MTGMRTIGSRIVLEGLGKYISGLDQAERKTQGFGGSVEGASKRAGGAFGTFNKQAQIAALGAVAAFGGIGVSSLKLAADFETTMSRIAGLTSTPESAIAGLREQILKLSTEVAISPNELGAGAYFILSSGITDVATAMKVLELSAKAAKAGLGETQVIASTVTSVMNAYGFGVNEAERATNALVNTIKLGKGEPAELAQALGFVIPFASQLGVEIEEVGGIIATLTNVGLGAENAVTALKNVFSSLLSPTDLQREAFGRLGLSVEVFRQRIEEDAGAALTDLVKRASTGSDALKGLGLSIEQLSDLTRTSIDRIRAKPKEVAQAFDELSVATGLTKDRMAELLGLPLEGLNNLTADEAIKSMATLQGTLSGADSVLAQLFPDVRSLTGVLGAFGVQGEATTRNIQAMKDGTTALDDAFAAVQRTANFKLQKAMQAINVTLIRTGAVILPGLVKVLDKVTPILEKRLPRAAIYVGKVLNAMGEQIQFVTKVFEFLLQPVLGAIRLFDRFVDVLGAIFSPVSRTQEGLQRLHTTFDRLPRPLQTVAQLVFNVRDQVALLLGPVIDLLRPLSDFVGSLDSGSVAAHAAALAIAGLLAVLVVSRVAPFVVAIADLARGLADIAGKVVTFTIRQVTELVGGVLGGATGGVVEGATAAGTELAGEALAIPKSTVLEMDVAHMSVQRMDVTPQITDKGDAAVKEKGKDLGGKFGFTFLGAIAGAVGSFLAGTLGPPIGAALAAAAGSAAFAFGAAAIGGAIVGAILGTIVAGIASFVIPGTEFAFTFDPAEIGRRVESQVLAPIAAVLKGIASFNLAGPGGLLSRLNDVFTEGLFNLPSVIAGAAAGIFLSLGKVQLFLLRQLGHLEVSVAKAIVGIAKAFDLQKIFRGAGDAPLNIGKAAFRILEAIGEIELDLLNALGSLEVAVAKGIAGINLGKIFQVIYDAPIDIAVGLFRGFEFVGRAIVDGVIKGGLGRVKDLANFFIEMFDKNVYRKVREFFEIGSPSQLMARLGSDIIAGLLLGVVAAVPVVVAFFNRLGGRILGSVQTLPRSLVGIGRSLITGFATGVSAAWEGADDFFYGLPDLILDTIGDLGGLLLDLGEVLIEGLFSGVTSLWDNEKAFWSDLPGAVIGLIGDVSRTLYQLGDNILAGLFSGVRFVYEGNKRFFSELPGNVVGLIGDVSTTLYSLGSTLLQGMFDGVEIVAKEMAGFVVGLPARIVAALTALPGIGTMLFSVGKSFVQGFLDGMANVGRGVANILNKIIRALNAIPDIDVLGVKLSIPEIPEIHLQRGTEAFKGGLARVGEVGRELAQLPSSGLAMLGQRGQQTVNLPRGTRVWPHRETEQIMSAVPHLQGGAGFNLPGGGRLADILRLLRRGSFNRGFGLADVLRAAFGLGPKQQSNALDEQSAKETAKPRRAPTAFTQLPRLQTDLEQAPGLLSMLHAPGLLTRSLNRDVLGSWLGRLSRDSRDVQAADGTRMLLQFPQAIAGRITQLAQSLFGGAGLDLLPKALGGRPQFVVKALVNAMSAVTRAPAAATATRSLPVGARLFGGGSLQAIRGATMRMFTAFGTRDQEDVIGKAVALLRTGFDKILRLPGAPWQSIVDTIVATQGSLKTLPPTQFVDGLIRELGEQARSVTDDTPLVIGSLGDSVRGLAPQLPTIAESTHAEETTIATILGVMQKHAGLFDQIGGTPTGLTISNALEAFIEELHDARPGGRSDAADEVIKQLSEAIDVKKSNSRIALSTSEIEGRLESILATVELRSFAKGGFVPAGQQVNAVLHGPEAIIPLSQMGDITILAALLSKAVTVLGAIYGDIHRVASGLLNPLGRNLLPSVLGSSNLQLASFDQGGYVPAGQTVAAMLHGPELVTRGSLQASVPGITVNAPVSITINEMNWARVRSVALAAVDEALSGARSTAVRQGVPLSGGIA